MCHHSPIIWSYWDRHKVQFILTRFISALAQDQFNHEPVSKRTEAGCDPSQILQYLLSYLEMISGLIKIHRYDALAPVLIVQKNSSFFFYEC